MAAFAVPAAVWLAGAVAAPRADALVLSCDPLEATFEVLPRGGYNTAANRVSRDGRIVVGFGLDGNNEYGAPLLWNELGQLQLLERPAGVASNDWFNALEISDPDPSLGTRIVSGIARYTPDGAPAVRYVRWVDGVFEDTGIPNYGAAAGPSLVYPFGQAQIDATPDGQTLVGLEGLTGQAFTMDFASTTFTLLPGLGPQYGMASAVSDDGTVVAGSIYVEGPGCPGSVCVEVPAYWTLGTLGLLDTGGGCSPPYAPSGAVFDLSADGSVAVGRVRNCPGEFPVDESAIWRGTDLIELPMDLPGRRSHPSANSISPDGRFVVGSQDNVYGPAFIWDDEHGLRDLSTVLTYDYGLTSEMATWTLASAAGVTTRPDGTIVIVGNMWPTARGLPGNFSGFRVTLEVADCPDDDRDGLCNEWEEQGYVDVNCNGEKETPGTDLELPKADPRHMNIYVEVDFVDNSAVVKSALTDVEAAFAKVPNNLIGNPDGQPGITLFMQADETVPGPSGTWTASSDACAMPTEFGPIKVARFGRPAERGSPELISVKRRLFRYAVLGGGFDNEVMGTSVPFGPDFIATGGFDAGDRDTWAGVIMHELGHTLALGHGGPLNHQQYKPNYHSVMNYTWVTPAHFEPVDAGLGLKRWESSWILDYARTAFGYDLDEAAGLNEQNGLGGPAGHAMHFVPVGPLEGPVNVSSRPRFQAEQGPIDFDRDGDGMTFETLSDPANVNQVNPFDADDYGSTPNLERLIALDDWRFVAQTLKRTFYHPNWTGPSSCAAFALGFAQHDEITVPELQGMRVNAFMDCNGNGVEDTDELNAGTASDDNGNFLLDGCEPVVGDCDGDDDVDEVDRTYLVTAFGRSEGEPEYLECADLDHDRDVTFVDYQAWVAAYEAAQAAQGGCGSVGGGEVAMLFGVWVLRRGRGVRRGRTTAAGGGS